MSSQFKSFTVALFVLFSTSWAFCQEYVDSLLEDQFDSIRQTFEIQIDQKIEQLYRQFQIEIKHKQLQIDSLSRLVEKHERKIHGLQHTDNEVKARISASEKEVLRNKESITEEKERIKRLLGIAGPSILILILVSVLIYFLLLMKQQEQTDKKINALKKYTHSELEETRHDILKKFKKRIKTVSNTISQRSKKSVKDKKKKKSKEKSNK